MKTNEFVQNSFVGVHYGDQKYMSGNAGVAGGGGTGSGAVTRHDVEQLKEELQRLNTERSEYFNAYETTKRSNEATIAELRSQNKALKGRLQEAKKKAAAQEHKQVCFTKKDALR